MSRYLIRHVLSALVLCAAGCGTPAAIDLVIERADVSHALFLTVCSAARGDCGHSTAGAVVFESNSGDLKKTVAITLGDAMVTVLQLDFAINVDTHYATDVTLAKMGGLALKANIDAAGTLTLDCVAQGSCSTPVKTQVTQ